MRVLHVVATGDRRGAEVFASDLVKALNESGVSQRVAVLRDTASMGALYGVPTALLGSNGSGAPGLPLDPRTLRALRRAVDSWHPHVLQAHGGEALKYSIAATLGRETRVVYRRIGSAHPWVTSRGRRAMYGWLMRRATRVVAVAEALRDETISLFRVSADRIVTIPNGVDVGRLKGTKSREEARRALGIPPAVRVLLSVGAFTWEKDPFAQLDVADRVLRERPDVRYIMVGDGPLRNDVEATIARRGMRERVQVLAALSDVGEVMCASDVLLLASRTEGMPAVLIEAGMAGLPVAAYAVGGVPEVVVNGRTGLLAAPGDLDGLGCGVLRLLGDEGARGAMGRAARERCLSRFDIRAIAPRYLELYGELAGSSLTGRSAT